MTELEVSLNRIYQSFCVMEGLIEETESLINKSLRDFENSGPRICSYDHNFGSDEYYKFRGFASYDFDEVIENYSTLMPSRLRASAFLTIFGMFECNIESLTQAILKFNDQIWLGADWERCGFDLYFLFQPQVVSDIEKDSTMITTSIKHGVKGFFPATSDIKNKLENMKSLKMEFGIGAISSESSPMILMILMINGTQTDISIKSHYVFQKGDLYLRTEKKGSGYEGSLAKMAPGIITHSVFDNMTISPICYSQDDRVLII